MESISVLTGQHVTIAYKPSNPFERGVATALDWILQFFYVMFVYAFIENLGLHDSLHRNVFFTLLFIVFSPVIFYNFLFEGLIMNGQTPGKMLLRIKVTKADGTSVSLGQHFLRWLLRPVDFMPFLGGLGMFFIFFTKKKQRLGDLAADTIVVKTSGKIDIGAEYYDFDETYMPRYQDLSMLNDAQVRYIMSLLDLPPKYNKEKILDLAQKVKEVAGLEENRLPDRDFLRQVVKDYNYGASLGL